MTATAIKATGKEGFIVAAAAGAATEAPMELTMSMVIYSRIISPQEQAPSSPRRRIAGMCTSAAR